MNMTDATTPVWVCLICGWKDRAVVRIPTCEECDYDSMIRYDLVLEHSIFSPEMQARAGITIDRIVKRDGQPVREDLPKHEIWLEGTQGPTKTSHAVCLGYGYGADFNTALEDFANRHSWFRIRFDAAENRYWGASLFDNKEDAQKKYG